VWGVLGRAGRVVLVEVPRAVAELLGVVQPDAGGAVGGQRLTALLAGAVAGAGLGDELGGGLLVAVEHAREGFDEAACVVLGAVLA
jgi:hypothetical protein